METTRGTNLLGQEAGGCDFLDLQELFRAYLLRLLILVRIPDRQLAPSDTGREHVAGTEALRADRKHTGLGAAWGSKHLAEPPLTWCCPNALSHP